MEIVDAHHHLWELGSALHRPWLEGPPIPFRYGDYSSLRRSYLPADYHRDTANQNVVATVHIETEVQHDQEVV